MEKKKKKRKKTVLVLLFLVVLFGAFCCASAAASPARFVSRFFSNVFSAALRRLWSLAQLQDMGFGFLAFLNRPSVRYESGYCLDTVFDGSKHGIQPFSVAIEPSGELLVLDSDNSNIYRISLPLSKNSRPKLVAGSSQGYSGHVDGKPREARMNHPKGLTVDDKGNIYVADTKNKAIRKISNIGVTTIAGGKWNKAGHVDRQSEDAILSNDFEVVYVATSCSLLVVDRGKQAIREIQLHLDDCADQYGAGFTLRIAVLFASGFFGYMLAILQWRLAAVGSSVNDMNCTRASYSSSPYQKPIKSSDRPPLIPHDGQLGWTEGEDGFFTSIKKLFAGAASSFSPIFSGILSRKKQLGQHQKQMRHSFVVRDEELPRVEAKMQNLHKNYAFMAKNQEKLRELRHRGAYFNGWSGDPQPQQHLQKHRLHYSGRQTYYEPSFETIKEVVFGAVQEPESEHGRMEMKTPEDGDPFFDHYDQTLSYYI